MMRSSSFLSFQPGARSQRASAAAKGITDFLQAHDRMATLLPAVARMTALQKDCATLLPALFEICSVMRFESGQLVLATPNAAVATKLKQQLPKLQDGLLKLGWQVSAIRLKVQVSNISEKTTTPKQLALPAQAVSALAVLEDALESSPRNAALKAAIGAMLQRHRRGK